VLKRVTMNSVIGDVYDQIQCHYGFARISLHPPLIPFCPLAIYEINSPLSSPGLESASSRSTKLTVPRCRHSHIYKFCQSLRRGNSVLKLRSLKMWEKKFYRASRMVWSLALPYTSTLAHVLRIGHRSSEFKGGEFSTHGEVKFEIT
jgi:hypothetical protein